MKLAISLLLVVFPILGIIDAGYLTYEKLSGVVPPCNPPFDCQTVLKSPWSQVGPIPLSAFGLAFYLVMLILGALSTLEVKSIQIGRRHWPLSSLILLGGTAGFLFSLWLLFLMGVILQAWCFFCLLSAINCIIIFGLALLNYRLHTTAPAVKEEP